MKLSIVLMVKNEEKYLDQCLASLKPIRDQVKSELIIVDTGSEDKTVEIAKKYTDKVYFEEWNNDFASMRNKSIQYAQGEWLFILDGDEIVEKPEGIINFLKSKLSKKFNSGMINIKDIINEGDETAYVNSQILRLFKNSKNFCYEGAVHEQPRFKHPVIKIDSEIVHYGYLSTDQDLMEYKFQRNTELLKRELEKEPDNVYYWFQLSKSYGLYEEYEKALEANLKAYEIAKRNEFNLKNQMYVFTHLAICYYMNKRFIDLEKICLEAIKIKEGYLDLYFFLAEAQNYLKKHKDAIENYEKYLSLLSTKTYIENPAVSNTTVGKYEYVYLRLCDLYSKQDNKEEALKYVKRITSEKFLPIAIPQIIKLSITLGKSTELFRYFHKGLIEDKEKLKVYFQGCLERELQSLKNSETKNEIIKLFSTGENNYSLLNKIRLYLTQDEKIEHQVLEKIKNLDLTSLPVYFADIIYFYLKNNFVLGKILSKLREHTFQAYVQYLIKKYDNFSETALKYLKNTQEERSLAELRMKKVLEKYILFLDKVDAENYRYVWERYLEDGTFYITQVYNRKLIDDEMIYDVKDEEHAFLVYMVLAKEHKDKDEVKYVRYLRKALKVYPAMQKGVELQIAHLTQKKNQLKNEIEKIKEQIHILLSQKMYNEALAVINETLKIVPNDVDLYSIKSVILIYLQQLDIAQNTLEDALKINPYHEDCLYNLAYIYEQSNKINLAVEIYRKILTLSDKKELRDEVKEKLNLILVEQNKILDIFLNSIDEYIIKQYSFKKGKFTIGYPYISYLDKNFTFAIIEFILISDQKKSLQIEVIKKDGKWILRELKTGVSKISEKKSIKKRNNIKDKPKVLLGYRDYSGSNTFALYKSIPSFIREKFEVELVKGATKEFAQKVYESDIIVTTNMEYSFKRNELFMNKIVIDTWHGFPLKNMFFQDPNYFDKNSIAPFWQNVDYLTSYSNFYNEIINESLKVDPGKYVITGAPRNDFLFNSKESRNLLLKVLGEKDRGQKFIFYMPTFRAADLDKTNSSTNLFGFENFNIDLLESFLEENNFQLIVKLHPIYKKKLKESLFQSSRILLYPGIKAKQEFVDLYELLSATHILMTDYSSVYFDFLLLDKPLIFITSDINDYKQERGFCLEPFDKWTPGPKVTNQKQLQNEIIKYENDKNYYKLFRKTVKDQVHHFQDGQSSKRVWNFISSLYS